jgi:hypothetical protein
MKAYYFARRGTPTDLGESIKRHLDRHGVALEVPEVDGGSYRGETKPVLLLYLDPQALLRRDVHPDILAHGEAGIERLLKGMFPLSNRVRRVEPETESRRGTARPPRDRQR